MPSVEKLLVATAFLEVGAGLGLLAVPALVLMGVRGPAPETLVVARVAGAGMLVLTWAGGLQGRDGVALWPVVLVHAAMTV